MSSRLLAALDQGRATLYAVVVHALFVGVLLMTLDWAPETPPPAPKIESVQAVVVDEDRVQAELKRLEEQERSEQEQQAAQQHRLQEQARAAEARRRQEEQRLAELQKQLDQERQRHAEAVRQREEEEAKRLAALQQREQEAAKLAQLERQRKALAEQEKEEAQRLAQRQQAEAQEAKLAQARTLLAAEQERAEAERRAAEAERLRAEEAKRKAEEAQRKQQAEAALREQLALEQAALNQERQRLRERYLAQYAAQIQAVVQRNWIRPAGTPKGVKCSVRVEQIPGGEVVSAELASSCGSVALDRSVTEAVYRSSPLPTPPDPSLFERELNFVFEPED